MKNSADQGGCWERQFSFTVPLSTQMYKWEPVIIILGRRAITNLSSSRYETLGLVTTHHITCSKHTGRPEDYRFSLWKSEYTGNSTAGVPKKVQFHSAPRKLKYCILPSYQSSSLVGKSTPPLSNLWYTVHGLSLAATMDLC